MVCVTVCVPVLTDLITQLTWSNPILGRGSRVREFKFRGVVGVEG